MRTAKPFYTFPYGGSYKVQFRDPESGRLLNRISTGKTTKFEADMVAYGWLRDGIPTGADKSPRQAKFYFDLEKVKAFLGNNELTPSDVKSMTDILLTRGLVKTVAIAGTSGAESLGDYLLRFWDYENSPYVAERLGFGHPIGRSHCVRALTRVKKYWIPALGSKLLAELEQTDLIKFASGLLGPGKLAAGTRNAIMLVGKTALAWAFGKDLIDRDVTKGIPTITGEKEDRGILSLEEAKRLFAMPWADQRMFLANLTAAATGMRASEIAALSAKCFGTATIQVSHGYVEQQGLGPVKNRDRRIIKVDPRLILELRQLAHRNPTQSGFVFWDENRAEAPVDARGFNLALREMLITLRSEDGRQDGMGTSAANSYWDERNVDFHAWRHFAITYASRSDASKKALMRASGHKTEKIFDNYSNHQIDNDLEESGLAFGRTFGFISPFSAT